MAEINNNIPNFGHKIEIIKHPDELTAKNSTPEDEILKNEPERNEITDTGVLGRSQVKTTRGGDISRSTDEAAELAEHNPALLYGCEEIFNSLYEDYLEAGMEPSEAYMKALFGEQELLNIVRAS